MIEQDTIKLLRECDAGVKMGVKSIEDVQRYVRSDELSQKLRDCRREHDELGCQIRGELDRFGDEGKNPNPVAKSMSWMKTNVKLGLDDSDKTIADLITDGCNMGVKSLHRYLNQYQSADAESKGFANRLIKLEDDLAIQMRQYL